MQDQAHWKLICVHIPVKSHIVVLIATNHFLKQPTWLRMSGRTAEKNHFDVLSVTADSLNLPLLQHICAHIQENDPTDVNSARKPSPTAQHSPNTLEFIVARNHTSVNYVCWDFLKVATLIGIWECMGLMLCCLRSFQCFGVINFQWMHPKDNIRYYRAKEYIMKVFLNHRFWQTNILEKTLYLTFV